MDWRSIAWNNMQRSLRRYLGYLLASTLAVTIFSMFFLFLFNPAVNTLSVHRTVAAVMIICIVIVAFFAIFFIFYFHAVLIRVRNKEFGLFMTLGMTPGQVGGMIFWESLYIALAALVCGILLGSLCLQPFQWAMGAILALPTTIPFALSLQAILVTAVFFGAVFLIEAFFTALRVARRIPRALILGARSQQTPPRVSPWLVLLGLLCLGIAYDQATQFSALFLLNALPIVLLTIMGTFFLFSQIMVMLLGWLRRRSLNGIQLLIVARLTYRVRDYARMLAIVTVLNAMVLTGMGTVFSFLQAFEVSITQQSPFSLQLVDTQANPLPASDAQLLNILQQHHLTVQHHLAVPLLTGEINIDSTPVTVLSQTNFTQLRTALLHIHPDLSTQIPQLNTLSADQALLNLPQDTLNGVPTTPFVLPLSHQIQLKVGTTQQPFHVEQGTASMLNTNNEVTTTTLVVNDQVFAHLQQLASKAQQGQAYIFQLPNQQQTQSAIQLLQQRLGSKPNVDLGAASSGIEVLQTMSALLFAGSFVSLLFLFAAGSVLYFKLFTQQDEDQRQFGALARLGLQKREATRIIRVEFLLLFFLPVLVAAVHSSFATLDLIFLSLARAALARIIWSAVGVTCLVYALCFTFYFLIALVNYTRRVAVVTVG